MELQVKAKIVILLVSNMMLIWDVLLFPQSPLGRDAEEKKTMQYRALAPMNISQKREGQQDEYIMPDHPDFGRLLAINLSDKYYNATGKRVETEDIKFELKTDAKKIKLRKISIKEMSKEETNIKGFKSMSTSSILIPCKQYIVIGCHINIYLRTRMNIRIHTPIWIEVIEVSSRVSPRCAIVRTQKHPIGNSIRLYPNQIGI